MRVYFGKQLFAHFGINTVERSHFIRVTVFNAPTVADMMKCVSIKAMLREDFEIFLEGLCLNNMSKAIV